MDEKDIKQETNKEIEELDLVTESNDTFNGSYEEIFTMEDIENRKLHINYEIDKNVNELIAYHILRYNTLDKGIEIKDRMPIRIFINTHGGSVPDGFSLLSIMKLSKTPIYTITFGYCYSMGFSLFLGGTRRFISPDGVLMNHPGFVSLEDNIDRVIDGLNFTKKQIAHNDLFILAQTKMSPKELDKSKRADVYYFADQAYRLGIATEIIGKTCDIDEILWGK